MRVYRKVPDILPDTPALVRDPAAALVLYRIWNGRGWCGTIQRRRSDQWVVTTLAAPPETFLCFATARDLALSIARRARG